MVASGNKPTPAAPDPDPSQTPPPVAPSRQPLPQVDARRAALFLGTTVVGAMGLAVGNDLTTLFAHSPAFLFAVLAVVAITIGVLYFYGNTQAPTPAPEQATGDGTLDARGQPEVPRQPEASGDPAVAVSPAPGPPPATAPAPETRAGHGPDVSANTIGSPEGSSPPGSGRPSTGPQLAISTRPRRALPWWAVVLAVGAALGVAFGIGYGLIGRLFAHGTLPGLCSLAGIVVVLSLLTLAARHPRVPGWLGWLRVWRNTALAVGLAALGFSSGATLGYAQDLPGTPAAVQCPPPTELRVLASTEILAPLQAAITEFEQDERTAGGTSCYAIDITAYPAGSDDAANSAIGSGWNLSADGPRPDIWIPASTEELPTAKPTGGQPGVTLLGSIASSPIVIAVPAKSDTPELQAEAHGASLSSLYQAISGSFAFTIPSPRLSEAGRLGITDLYPSVTATLGQIARSGSYPLDSGALLCQVPQPAHGKPPAYLVSAAAVDASNRGDLGTSGCPGAPTGPLATLNTVGDSVLDFPFTTVTWNKVPPAVAGAERQFFRWLRPLAGPAPLTADGLQAPDQEANLPPEATIEAAVNRFSSSQPPARVIVAIDDSGLMQSSLSEIKQAVDGVLGPKGLGGNLKEGRDSFGIWTFPGPSTSGSSTATEQQLVPLGLDIPQQRALVQQRVPGVTGHDHSAEFDLVDAATGSSANSLVLLTDGDVRQVDAKQNSIGTVSHELGFLAGRGTPFKVYVIAFGSGCGETPSGSPASSLTALADAGGGGCVNAPVNDPVTLTGQLAKDISTLSTGG